MHYRSSHNAKGYAFVAVLVMLVLVLGWRASMLVAPIGSLSTAGKNDATVSSAVPGWYLAYHTYKVKDRRQLEHSFYRHPLGGSGSAELIAKTFEDTAKAYGSPWMASAGDDTLFFFRRELSETDRFFTDIYGRERTEYRPLLDLSFSGLPSPDGRWIAYAAEDAKKPRPTIAVMDTGDGSVKTYPVSAKTGPGRLDPIVWSADSKKVYIKPISNSNFTPGLWMLDTEAGTVSEITVVRKSGLSFYTIYPETGKLVGSTFKCDGLDHCGIGPSKLLMVDLASQKVVTLLEDGTLAYDSPLLSPDGSRIAFSYFGNDPAVWLVDVQGGKNPSFFISGAALAWTPDGSGLVVDRDRELQIIKLADKAITHVAKRTGKAEDPDFQGLDFIGVLRGNK